MGLKKTITWIIGVTAVTAIGVITIPPLIKKYGNKLYKDSLKKENKAYEDEEPEIVRKSDTKGD